jgi:acyl-lipid omega-6 desaturase (Delta-12 desaturase)
MTVETAPRKPKPAWVSVVAKYHKPSNFASISQIINSFGPYIALWVLMYISLQYSYWITLALSILAGAFVLRIFIIQHDCGHQSFFKKRKWNDLVGFVCGVVTLTPYEHWRTSHAVHHATSGDLDYRGFGDVVTKTVKEYMAFSPRQRLIYRLYRNPFIMFGIGALTLFLFLQRTPFALKTATTKQSRRSLYYTDVCLIALIIGISFLIGFDKYLLVQLPIAFIASTIGVWLFYVQHQFEDTYWRYHPEWDYTRAALEGSSYYKLPRILQWFTGNIGLHHIHHLSPRIPNYLLEQCYNENPDFQNAPTLTIRTSLRILVSGFALWDEEQDRLISFKEARERYMTQPESATTPHVSVVPVIQNVQNVETASD